MRPWRCCLVLFFIPDISRLVFSFVFHRKLPARVYANPSVSSMALGETIHPDDTSSTTGPKDTLLLRKWASHSEFDFHRFAPEDAGAIRTALLDWYVVHRRKLPWRGDEPPWQGSTAADRRPTSTDKKQKSLKNYFGKKKSDVNKTETVKLSASDADKPEDAAFPITGYGVWVSEIMLQQTRVEAVIPYWTKWMKSFPTVQDLAKADEETINAHWAGLGFYRRARMLHQASKVVTDEHNGELPQTVEGLMKLPGIGRYTASAIASVAFDVTVPVVDGNVCRVLSRLRGIAQHIKSPALKDAYGWDLAAQLVGAGDGSMPGQVNQALMELGATFCSPSGTGIHPDDPLKDFYMSTEIGRQAFLAMNEGGVSEISKVIDLTNRSDDPHASHAPRCPVCDQQGVVETWSSLCAGLEDIVDGRVMDNPASVGHSVFPMPPPKTAKREEILAIAVLCTTIKEEPAWLLVKRPKTGLLAGQWEFPPACLWNSDNESGKKNGKRKDMSENLPKISPDKRKRALDKMLSELRYPENVTSSSNLESSQRKQLEEPVQHIFSHVRHTMWIESAAVKLSEDELFCEGITLQNREAKWMTRSQMKSVGVTSGVKKILQASEKNRSQNESTKSKSKRVKR